MPADLLEGEQMTDKIRKIMRIPINEGSYLKALELESRLDELIPHVQPPNRPRLYPLKLGIPKELAYTIDRLLGHNRKQKSSKQFRLVLIASAKRYRQLYPIDPNWKEPTQAEYTAAEAQRRQTENVAIAKRESVLRFTREDKELLQNLGRGREGIYTRDAALRELVPIIKEMDRADEFLDLKSNFYYVIALNVSSELDTALITASHGFQRKYTTLLRHAAQRHRESTRENKC
jgi:hypothetical protein